MTMRAASAKTPLREDISFLLSNRIPHQLANRFLGWFSQIEAPLLARVSIAIWRLFADLDLSESQTQRFTSLHACFTRALKPGARPVDPDPHILTSPCDGIIGACGRIDRNELIQAKGSPYTLQDLLIDPQLVELYPDGQYVTFAADAQHVPSLPCAIRLHRRQGHLYFRRFVERQSDRARPHCQIVL